MHRKRHRALQPRWNKDEADDTWLPHPTLGTLISTAALVVARDTLDMSDNGPACVLEDELRERLYTYLPK